MCFSKLTLAEYTKIWKWSEWLRVSSFMEDMGAVDLCESSGNGARGLVGRRFLERNLML